MTKPFRFAGILFGLAGLLFGLAAVPPAYAGGGVLDVLDSGCVKARAEFRAYREAVAAPLDDLAAKADTGVVPESYGKLWRDALHKQVRPEFEAKVLPSLRDQGASDVNYDTWFDHQLRKADPEALKREILKNLKQDIALERERANAEVSQQGDKLGQQCKSDVGSQLLRGAINLLMMPAAPVLGNLARAREHTGDGVISQAFEAATGVNLSEAIKNPSGGDKSAVRELGRAIDKTFNPFRW